MFEFFYKKSVLASICLILLTFILFDCKKDTEIDEFKSLTSIDPHIISNKYSIFTNTSDSVRLESIQNAIKILEEVNPKIAIWIKKKIQNKELVFTNDDKGYYAKYDFISKKLYVNKSVFSESDGVIAVTLAHEYRHSRQNYTKFIKYTLSFLIYNEGNDSLVESDALAYEMKAYNAIFSIYE